MSDFNLREKLLDTWSDEYDEAAIEKYNQTLLDLFAKSTEGKAFLEANNLDKPHWSELLLEFMIRYIGLEFVYLYDQILREILYDLIPAKVIVPANKAEQIITELKAFFEFVKREFDHPHIDSCLKVVNQKNIVKRLQKEMSNTAKFGMTKSIMMPAIEAGIDLADEQALQKYMEEYNQKIRAEKDAPPEPLSKKTQAKYQDILKQIEAVCKEHLNQEYAEISQDMAEELLEFRPCPFDKGRASSWAAGLVYAVGQVNFLFDPSQNPHLSAGDLAKKFDVSQGTASSKAKEIRDLLDLMPFHPDWTIRSNMDQNPLIWMFNIDGMMVDIRSLPRAIQEQAYNQGLIPYIPADRKHDDA